MRKRKTPQEPIRRKVAIIGAGYSGLNCARLLMERGYSVTLFERLERLGGLAVSFKAGSYQLEAFYHHFFTSDQVLIDVANELGVGDKIIFEKAKSAIYYQGRIHQLSNAWDLLTFSPLPLYERLNFGLLLFKSPRIKDWHTLDRISAKEWIVKQAGRRTYEVLWQPLLVSKFGSDAETISASWLWSKFVTRAGNRQQGSEERLGYFKDGGFAVLTDALIRSLLKGDCKIRTATAISQINRINGHWQIATDRDKERFDAVVYTAPLPLLGAMLKGVDSDFIQRLESYRLKGNICMVMALSEPLSDIYWLSINETSSPFIAVIEHTNFINPSAYDEQRIVYLSRYLDQNDSFFHSSDEAVRGVFLTYLKRIFPNFSESTIINSRIIRARYTQPVTPVGYGENLLAIRTPYKGLYLATMSQIYPQDRGTNFALKIGKEAAEALSQDF